MRAGDGKRYTVLSYGDDPLASFGNHDLGSLVSSAVDAWNCGNRHLCIMEAVEDK